MTSASISAISFGKGRKDAVARRRDEHIVFDADADLFFGNVDAGLDGDHHVRLERTRRITDIVDLQPDVMAGPVNEIFLVAFGANVIHRGLMDVADPGAGFDLRDRRLLGIENDLIDLALAR